MECLELACQKWKKKKKNMEWWSQTWNASRLLYVRYFQFQFGRKKRLFWSLISTCVLNDLMISDQRITLNICVRFIWCTNVNVKTLFCSFDAVCFFSRQPFTHGNSKPFEFLCCAKAWKMLQKNRKESIKMHVFQFLHNECSWESSCETIESLWRQRTINKLTITSTIPNIINMFSKFELHCTKTYLYLCFKKSILRHAYASAKCLCEFRRNLICADNCCLIYLQFTVWLRCHQNIRILLLLLWFKLMQM